VKLVSEKEDLLKVQQKDIMEMKDKFLRTYAEQQNLMDRTNRNAESAKKFAVQVYFSTPRILFLLSCINSFCFVYNPVLNMFCCAAELCNEPFGCGG